MVQYLNSHLSRPVHFDLALDFADFHARLESTDLAYVNPADCYKLRTRCGFTPLARPAGLYDEALLVTAAGSNLTIDKVAGAPVASVATMLPTKIALRMLRQRGVNPSNVAGCDSWLGVVRSVWGGDVPFGILYRDAYEDLSDQGKGMIQILARSDERIAFHCFSAGPRAADLHEELSALLLSMAADALGREILAELQVSAWAPISEAELDAMQGLVTASI